MANKSFWTSFEKYLGNNRIPKSVKKILIASGFDCSLTLQEINENTIKVIETFVNNNRDLLINTEYSISETFSFLPGHRLLILSFPKKAREFTLLLSSEQKKKKTVSEFVMPSQEKLEHLLIKKLKIYASKLEFTLNISTKNIIDIKIDETVARCTVKCLFCDKRIPCSFQHNHWAISNLQKHLKRHIQTFFAQENSELVNKDRNRNDTPESNIVRVRTSLSELQNI